MVSYDVPYRVAPLSRPIVPSGACAASSPSARALEASDQTSNDTQLRITTRDLTKLVPRHGVPACAGMRRCKLKSRAVGAPVA